MYISEKTRQFIREHQSADVRSLALQTKKAPGVDLPFAITQIAGKQAAAGKIPSWHAVDGILYPRHLSLEQCSSEVTARYKATLVDGTTFADLTGGFGIDCFFLSSRFASAAYVERQEELCEIASHNFPLLGAAHIRVENADAITYLKEMLRVDCIFVDPARRNQQGGKTVAISDCEPDVAALEDLLLQKARQVLVKLSPMLDLTRAIHDIKHTRQVHVVSVHNECKEVLLLAGQEETAEIPIHCINFTHKGTETFIFTRQQEQEADCLYASETGNYLYEPNASLLKAGAFRTAGSVYQLRKLHPNSHLYTSDTLVSGFPGRTFRVKGTCSFNKKELKDFLAGMTKANLAIRNFPASVAELRKRTKLAEGGTDYLFATTLNNGQKVLILGEKLPVTGM